MKAYCIIYNGHRWSPRECEILEEFEDGDQWIEYTYCGKVKRVRVPKRYVFLTYEAARQFCYYYK